MMIDRTRKIAEGKTKVIWATGNQAVVVVHSKDDVTAGNGKRHDVIPGKGALANATTCRVFERLVVSGVDTAFIERVNETCFAAYACDMIPYEVVVRFKAAGSILKRHPDLSAGESLDPPLVEFYLKTSDKRWLNHALPVDDPLVKFVIGEADLHHPDQPDGTPPFLTLSDVPLMEDPRKRHKIKAEARYAATILRDAWAEQDCTLLDVKFEFGYRQDTGALVLADVIDADSWRVLDANGNHLDKQPYRNGASVEETLAIYRRAADIAARF